MRVLVCGGRNFSDRKMMEKALSTLNNKHGIELIIHGGATGADAMSGKWSEYMAIPYCVMPANWEFYGPKAGSLRNQWMIELLAPEAIVAFPGGKGTENMVMLAKEAGLKVWEVGRTQPKFHRCMM